MNPFLKLISNERINSLFSLKGLLLLRTNAVRSAPIYLWDLKPTITFKDQTDTVLTITNTPFYEDYNKDTNGNIEKDTKIERIGISNDNVWSKLKYNNKIIYVKTENLKLFVEEIIDPNENNDSE